MSIKLMVEGRVAEFPDEIRTLIKSVIPWQSFTDGTGEKT